MPKVLSVIIPTHNRSAILAQTLDALCRQAFPPDTWEVVVVDDGSTDDTADMVADLAMRASDVELRCIRQEENRGAGAARNNGLRQAAGEIVLFIDSDIVAAPGLLAQHLLSHRLDSESRPNIAVLGHVLLAPGLPTTPMNLSHVVHMWRGLQNGQELDWRYFVTCNISVKRSFLLDNNLWFDESLKFFEDTELGYRSCQRGLRIFYNAQAMGYHNHHLTLLDYLRLTQDYGETLAVLHNRTPKLGDELASYLPFSWRNPPRRVACDLLRPLLLNRFSAALLVRHAQLAEGAGGCASAAVIHRIGNYYERAAYRRRVAELATT